VSKITFELWLYGPLSKYGGEKNQGSHAHLELEMSEGSTVGDVVSQLRIPGDERGITFINGNLAALPGLDADLTVVINDGDRVAISHPKSIWPFQYRFGANITPELKDAFRDRPDRGIRHAYTGDEEPDSDLTSG
jgi:hypothetical protein